MTAGEEIKPSEAESKLESVVTEKGSTPAPPAPTTNGTEPTKLSFRLQTWEKLEKMEQVVFPRPCKFRIPRFKGENEAVEKLAELDAFKESKVVKVNLDKAHERVRLEVIQSGKSLIAGTPGLKEAVFLLMRPPMEANKLANRLAASRIGIRHLGSALDFYSGVKAELVVLGSVAVDRKGHRIGKGEGFTDLEYAILSKLGIIDPEATIVTVVHDLQVYEELPESIFKPWDVPVDIIVTPTQVIHIEKKLPRPSLQWNLLSNRRVNDIPIIKQLLEKEQNDTGTKIELKEVDSETEGTNHYYPPLRTRRRRFIRRRRMTSAPSENGMPHGGAMNRMSSAPPPRGGTRTFRQRNQRQNMPPNGITNDRAMKMNMNNKGGMGRRLGPPIRKIRRPRYTVDFSVRVDGLTSGVRIRELKAALLERNVRPIDISWRAAKGVALLHFAKKRPSQVANGVTNASMEEIVSQLQGLAIKTEDGNSPPELKVEGVKPIPRTSTSEEKEQGKSAPGATAEAAPAQAATALAATAPAATAPTIGAGEDASGSTTASASSGDTSEVSSANGSSASEPTVSVPLVNGHASAGGDSPDPSPNKENGPASPRPADPAQAPVVQLAA